MGRTALLCWECGRGLGHVVALAAIARALEKSGWRTSLALPPARVPDGAPIGDLKVGAAPSWDDQASAAPFARTNSSASMGDILADVGLRSTDAARAQIAGWRALFTEHAPDLVIADYAPGAVLAARGRILCMAVGTGFSVPPPALRSFPPLHDLAPIRDDEQILCSNVNSALADFGIPPVEYLPEALTGDAQCLRTIDLLDPYARLRSGEYSGPLLTTPIEHRVDGADEIFCYLREGPEPQRLDEIAACLEGLPGKVVAFLPGVSAGVAERLRRSRVCLLDRPAPLAEQLARSRLVIHFGGHGMAAAALLAGVPQVILDFDIEKYLIAGALSRRGIASRVEYLRAGPDMVREAILAALDDPVLDREAGRAADEYDRCRGRDVASNIAEACGRMVM